MSSNYCLAVLGCLEELNSLRNDANSKKVVLFEIDTFTFGLLIFSFGASRISFLKLSLSNNAIFSAAETESSFMSAGNNGEDEPFKVYLLNVFCLPFILLDLVCTSENIWAIGQESVIDIKPYTESVLKKENFCEGDDYMDTDEVEEFLQNAFELAINVHQIENYNFHHDDIFIGCNFIENCVAICNKNTEINKWHLKVVFLKTSKMTYGNTIPIVDFPVSFQKSSISEIKTAVDPFIVFLKNSDSRIDVMKGIFGIDCSSSTLCLIGHPDGKLLWSVYDYNNSSYSAVEPLLLYDFKQPIIGFHFVEKISKYEAFEFFIIVGALGKITLFSPKKLPLFILSTGRKQFWFLSTHLKSSVAKSAVINDSLLYFSNDGTLWITDLSELISNTTTEKIHLTSTYSDLSGVKEIVTVNKSKGIVLVRTAPGNIYLAVCRKESNPSTVNSSLASLMNECLQQSNTMQKLLHTKGLQCKLFSTVSTFASLKFLENTIKEPITFSITEINLQPKKFMLVINLQCFENLHLDPHLCYVSASVFTYFQNDYTLVSKTVPYNPDQPTLCLELTDTVLQPPFVSIFPLFVEVGIILQLPDEWKIMDCFKLISSCLPLYLRIQTFMVHELHLFQSNTLCMPQSFNRDESKFSLNIIKQLGMERPISNLLKVGNKKAFHFPLHFNFCMSVSTVEEMMKYTEDTDPCKFVHRLLLKGPKDKCDKKNYIASKNSPISVSVTKNNSMLLITITASSFVSLLDLRMAVMDLLLTSQNKCITNSSAYVNIPGSIHGKCEEMSKTLLSLYDRDVESDEVFHTILQSYQELRKHISEKLPVL